MYLFFLFTYLIFFSDKVEKKYNFFSPLSIGLYMYIYIYENLNSASLWAIYLFEKILSLKLKELKKKTKND